MLQCQNHLIADVLKPHKLIVLEVADFVAAHDAIWSKENGRKRACESSREGMFVTKKGLLKSQCVTIVLHKAPLWLTDVKKDNSYCAAIDRGSGSRHYII